MGRRTAHLEEKKKKKGRRKAWLIPLLAVLVLGGIGGGVYAYFSRNIETPVTVGETPQETTTPPVEETPPVPTTTIPKEEMEIPILMYHLVEEEAIEPNVNLFLRPSEFEEEMAYLAENGYTPVTMSEVAAYFNGQGTLPVKPIALCFDDGAISVYTNAFPIMEKYGFKSTQFIIGGYMNNPGYMSTAQVQEMAAAGHEIGSHTYSHPDLTSQDSSGLAHEIGDSKTFLEEISGKPVVSLCYPSGKYDDTVMASAAEYGYTSAVTTEYDFGRLDQGLYRLSRIRIARGDGRESFQSKLAPYEEFINAHL